MQQRRALDTFKASDWCRWLTLWLGLCLLAAAGAGNLARAQPTLPAPNAALTNADEAIRVGDWKLVEQAEAPGFESVRNKRKTEAAEKKKKAASRKDELYNLQNDPAETKDVISANADRAAAMRKLLNESRDRGYTRPGAGK